MSNENLEEVLREAIEMEEKGHNFYLDAAEKASNNITRKTLEFLAENEVYHIENIKNFYETCKDKGKFPALNIKADKGRRMDELNIFAKSIKELQEKIDPEGDDVKVCEFAMDFENKGYAFYEKIRKEAKDENLIKLLDFLLEEETSHYELIENLHLYLTDSHNWFMYEEDSFPQGG